MGVVAPCCDLCSQPCLTKTQFWCDLADARASEKHAANPLTCAIFFVVTRRWSLMEIFMVVSETPGIASVNPV